MALQNPHSDASNMTIIPTSRIPDAISKEEDWSGKPSSERRKLQNRLNQRARHNILRAAIQDPHFDEDELWFDLLETKCAPGSAESPSLLVWGEPWDIWKWEVNIEFLRKWSHLLDGCTTLLESTNYWRRRRGERPISFSSNPTESRR
ncbi:unnamed protein product [Alternaria alternata]